MTGKVFTPIHHSLLEMSVKITQIEGRKLQPEFERLKIISGKTDEGSLTEEMSPGKLMAAA